MKFLTNPLTACAAALLAAATVSAQEYRVFVRSDGVDTRAWYADGNMYIGPTVSSVPERTDFTVTGLSPLAYLSVPTDDDIPDSTFFMVADGRFGGVSPVYFVDNGSGLETMHKYRWKLVDDVFVEVTDSGAEDSQFFAQPVVDDSGEGTDEDTYVVAWRTDGSVPEGGKKVDLVGLE